jgi:hypothetical protein
MRARSVLAAMAFIAVIFALGACGSDVSIAVAPDGGTGGGAVSAGTGAAGGSLATGGSGGSLSTAGPGGGSLATGGAGGSLSTGGAGGTGGSAGDSGSGGSVATGGKGGSAGDAGMGGASGSDGGGPCTSNCTTENANRCSGREMQTCTKSADGCLVWTSGARCPTGQSCNSDATRCVGPALTCNAPSDCGCGCTCTAQGQCGMCTGGLPPTCLVDSNCGPPCSGTICQAGKCVQRL